MKLLRTLSLLSAPLIAAAFWAGCSSSADGPTEPGDPNNPDGGTGGGGFGVDPGAGGGTSSYTPVPWPDEAINDPLSPAPDGAADLFAAGATAAGPCVHEPRDGSMIPKNWLRPRFRFTAAAGEDVFQITLTSAAAQGKQLVIYTTNPQYTMDGGYFAWIAQYAGGGPLAVDVTVRSVSSAGGAVGETSTSFNIAPVSAGGSMVYWATTGSGNELNATKLEGFSVGEEGVVDALLPVDIGETGMVDEAGGTLPDYGNGAGKVSCIGCHTSTPDGGAVAFTGNWPWPAVMASVDPDSADPVGARPSYVTDSAAAAMKQPFLGTFTFSPAYWAEGVGGKAVTVIQAPLDYPSWQWDGGAPRNIVDTAELAWIDTTSTEAAVAGSSMPEPGGLWGYVNRSGDTGAVANPSWSKDGQTIVYASCAQVAGGHPGGISAADGITPLQTATECDIYKVPFADGAGGAATPVSAEAGAAEYYPDISADDSLVAYTRRPTSTGYHYYAADGEIYVNSIDGGAPTRLAANDPPSNSAACPVEASPGVLNSWPKWSPAVETAGGDKYYWLIFSSGRSFPEQFTLPGDQWTPTGLDRRSSQLYLAPVVVKADGTVQSYAATYIWNQTKSSANLTPAWDEFKIPQVTVK